MAAYMPIYSRAPAELNASESGESEMTIQRNRFLLTSLALIGLTVPTALADEWDKEMVFQFSSPVEVPGKVLQPGKYVFRLADSPSNRNIVQIFSVNERGRQDFIATILAVPDYRLMTPEKPVVLLEERHLGSPEAIKSWFYPGDNTGWHFVYPKSEQLEVATNVAPPPPAPVPAEASVPTPSVADEPAQQSSVVVEEGTVVSELVFAPEPGEDGQPDADRLLPDTSGHSAMILLTGILIIGFGLAAVSLSQRRARVEAK
jgi:hypothetical protein